MKVSIWYCVLHGVVVGDIITQKTTALWWQFWNRGRKYRVIKINDANSYSTVEIIPFWQFWRKK